MDSDAAISRAWARRWLIAAGVYNLVWGAVVIAAPGLIFRVAGMEPMRYPEIWQCVGMIVGVYGIGYLVAAGDHRRHWPIVLVGLLGKIFGPIGFAFALAQGRFEWPFVFVILTNDLVWWVPFGMMLWDAARGRDAIGPGSAPTMGEALESVKDAGGRSLGEMSEWGPTLIVLPRHTGCTFCKEMLADLASRQDEIRGRGYQIAVVTMSAHEENAALAERYGLGSVSWFSDPDRLAYRALELKRGRFTQLFGVREFVRGAVAAMRGHVVGKLRGDGFQMPGAFVIDNREVVRAFRHEHASQTTDFDGLACPMPA